MHLKRQGMTLLEIIVTMALFAAAFIYISEILRFHLKQQKKISRRIKISRVKENVFEVLKQDLKNALFFYDINSHFPELYPVLLDSEEDPLSQPSEEGREPLNIMESQFDFLGEGQKLRFVSFIRIPVSQNSPPHSYVVRVKYFLRDCENLQTRESSRCLARAISRNWIDMEDDQDQDVINLLAGIKNIEFSYFDGADWHKEWSFSNRWKMASRKPEGKADLFPGFVRLEMEWEDKKLFKVSHDFAVSHPFLRFHYPGEISALAFLDIKQKKKSDEKPTEKPPQVDENTSSSESPRPPEISGTASPPNPTPAP